MRIAVDTGGTFTDAALVWTDGQLVSAKSPTNHADPARGVIEAVEALAERAGTTSAELLAATGVLVHGTTRSLNAMVTGSTAATALLTTAGHGDVLVFREGGRDNPFDHGIAFPPPYIPRRLTFEISGRIDPQGNVIFPLDESGAVEIITRLVALDVEAVAVSFLWAHVNPVHELRVAELIAQFAPELPVSLGHRVNPLIREFRRSSSAAIDASLKPIITPYLQDLESCLRARGFRGELLLATAVGGCVPAAEVAASPILSLNSGPSMAPVLGAAVARHDCPVPFVVVADTGGTTYDLSVVVGDQIPRASEARVAGHLTGFPAVDVRGLGAGGGSIATVDGRGLLRVGPKSAGADPGPACYGRGGSAPTVTDAALITGRIDPEGFLGGRLRLDADAAAAAVGTVGGRLGLDSTEAAAAILAVATETMATALLEVTIGQGIDPREAVLVAGGGAAGLNSVAIARRAGIPTVVFPAAGAVMSAAGALIAEITSEHTVAGPTSTRAFDEQVVNRAFAALDEWAADQQAKMPGRELATAYSAAARYAGQAWEIAIPIDRAAVQAGDTTALTRAFHGEHERLYAVADPDAAIEVLAWQARARVAGSGGDLAPTATSTMRRAGHRKVFFHGSGWTDAERWQGEFGGREEVIAGPAVIDGAYSSILIDHEAIARTTARGSLVVSL